MCGFVGAFNFDENVPICRERLILANDLISHRGPDDEGYFLDGPLAFAHKRLSVIDLSEDGRQPLSDQNGRYWIVYNGEIYNHVELRSELTAKGYKFNSQSDTEVLLYSYIAYGKDCLDKLEGMFAFAIWDKRERTLFAARDPFGIKPFYFIDNGSTFFFASEIKALLCLSGIERAINPTALADYLTFQYILGRKSLFKNIVKLEPGTYLHVTHTGVTNPKIYWKPRFDKINLSEEDASEQFLNLLTQSVRQQLRSDVPLGAHLSGGLDTAAIVGLTSRMSSIPVSTFTAGFQATGGIFDDTDMARVTANFNNTSHYVAYPDATDFINHFEEICWHLDEPTAAPGSIPQYFVSKLASEHVKVVLGGQGADELAGGYARYILAYLDANLRSSISGRHPPDLTYAEIEPGLRQLANYGPLMGQLFTYGTGGDDALRYARLITRQQLADAPLSDDMMCELNGYDPIETFRNVFNAPGPNTSLLDRMLNYETTTWLPSLLHVEDRMSMAWSVESRVPFLSRHIADFLFSLSSATRMKNGRLKHLMRRAVENVVPPEVSTRENKIGFPVPLHEWFAHELKDWLADRLHSKRSTDRGIFHTQQATNISDQQLPFDRSTWGLVNIETWCRLMLDGDGFRTHANTDTAPRETLNRMTSRLYLEPSVGNGDSPDPSLT